MRGKDMKDYHCEEAVALPTRVGPVLIRFAAEASNRSCLHCFAPLRLRVEMFYPSAVSDAIRSVL